MIAEFGYGIALVSFLVAIYSIVAAVYGAQKKIRFHGGKRAARHVTHISSYYACGRGIDLFIGQ